jgi:phage shock protein PspC (stress-responsive transcriptional regulator)
MKEITRIHIAKVPYDIEITAKKHLEAYLKTLDAYGMDAEIIGDIEIRITEILMDRGVKKDNVISDADVAALVGQLGEPSDFVGDDATVAKKNIEAIDVEASRKLFRNTDNAIFGGVLSGAAIFLGLDVVWVRLIFILVSFVSFGAVSLVYVVLWIAVPPMKTAADRLRMLGKPVTIESIRELNKHDGIRASKDGSASGRRAVLLIMGVASVMGALIAMLITVAVGVRALMRGYTMFGDGNSHLLDVAFLLFILSGLLLTILFILAAFASFAQRVTRKVIISICVVIALGLASFGTAIGFAQYSSLRHGTFIQEYFSDKASNKVDKEW